jgi:hypothetical protein
VGFQSVDFGQLEVRCVAVTAQSRLTGGGFHVQSGEVSGGGLVRKRVTAYWFTIAMGPPADSWSHGGWYTNEMDGTATSHSWEEGHSLSYDRRAEESSRGWGSERASSVTHWSWTR